MVIVGAVAVIGPGLWGALEGWTQLTRRAASPVSRSSPNDVLVLCSCPVHAVLVSLLLVCDMSTWRRPWNRDAANLSKKKMSHQTRKTKTPNFNVGSLFNVEPGTCDIFFFEDRALPNIACVLNRRVWGLDHHRCDIFFQTGGLTIPYDCREHDALMDASHARVCLFKPACLVI